MKKTLHPEERAFLFEKNGKIFPEEMSIDEIIAAVNKGINGEWGDDESLSIVLRKIHEWICRYLNEGVSDEFLNELNSDLHEMQYYQYVLPADFYSLDRVLPQSLCVANMNNTYSHKTIAAKEFSRLITSGKLSRIKRCQRPSCENIYIGPPQSKWCSKTCGSKFRVNKKRKRDSS